MNNVSNKHAYCIIAHNEPLLLKRLIKAIDDERNDIYLLIDKKARKKIVLDFHPKYSQLFILNSIDVRWGDISLIEAEYEVFECAFNHGPYKIYHLLSGADFPIKSQDYIHQFINQHPNTEFLSFSLDESNCSDLRLKTQYYHFFTKYSRHPIRIIRTGTNYLRTLYIAIQKRMGVKRHYQMDLYKGSQWCSITNDLCSFVLSKKSEILKMFRHTLCCDEVFLQSIVFSTNFKDKLYKRNGAFTSLREIDWGRGFPYTWGAASDNQADVSKLRDSPNLFARKFSIRFEEIINEVEQFNQSSS